VSNTVIKVENISKQYRLGEVGTGTISHDLNRWWAKMRGKEDPFLKIGETNDRTTSKGSSDYVWALKDINFDIQQGDAVGIIGRNGAGKSTLLKILSKTTTPTTGSIKIKGRIASLLEVGTGFHPEMTGRENIFLNGAILGMRKKEIARKFDEIVDFAGVERYIDTPVKRYSSGMYVRLAFAVAAHLESEILIVDEVLAVGDAEFQKKCLGKMGEVSKGEGRTVLFVSHNMNSIKDLCNKGILLQNGTLAQDADVNSVLSTYMATSTESITKNLGDLRNHSGARLYGFISNIYIYDPKTQTEKGVFLMGDAISVKLKVQIHTYMQNAEVGIKISSISGTALTYLVSCWEGISGDLDIGEHAFVAEIPKILLYPGKYHLSPWLKIRESIADDSVQEACLIEILNHDITGYNPRFDAYAYSGCEIHQESVWSKI
jgi:lipopolysaccharide transport system ATP-binding protein